MDREGSPDSGWSSTSSFALSWSSVARATPGLALCMCMLTAAANTARAEPPVLTMEGDIRQELQARQALAQDSELGPLNLGVRVRQRVAVLWGPVPSADLGKRAVELVKRLPELIDVHSELHVQPVADPVLDYLPPMQPPPMGQPWGAPPTRPAVVFTNHSARSLPEPSSRAFQDSEAEPVLPAIRIPRSSSGPVAESTTGPPLIEAVMRVQRGDARFRQLRPEVQGALVRLHGDAGCWADIHELARRLTAVPGVERVVLGEIRIVTTGK
jgi:hypothetical protein